MRGNIKQRGFTLIEAVVAAGIFIIIFVLVIDLAVIFTRNPQRIIRQKQIETDVNYLMEKAAQKIRISNIDYDTYDLLGTPISNPDDFVYLINDSDGSFSISKSSGDILLNTDPLNSNKTVIDQFIVYVNPIDNPFCNNFETGAYIACLSDTQPRVTMAILAHHVDDANITFNIQTTISSRIYER